MTKNRINGQSVVRYLRELVGLDNYIAIYVPSTICVNKPTSSPWWVEHTAERMSKLFGGVTITKAEGGWVSESGELVREGVTIVRSNYNSSMSNDQQASVIKLARKLKGLMKQESVSVDVNGKMYFI